MKRMKTLSLAMALTALMAFAAAPASATELYSGATTLPSGTVLHLSLIGFARLSTTGGTVLDECSGSTLTGSTTNSGGAGVNVVGTVGKSGLTWSGCTKTTDTLEGGTLEIAYTSGLNGTVSGKAFKVTVEMVAEFGGTCSYTLGTGGTTLGELKGSTSSSASISINAVVNGASGNSFLCPSTTRWVAVYAITAATYNGKTYTPVHATNS
jgi:hypothetical protein